MLRVGNLAILVMPGELTTMSGRRMRCVPLHLMDHITRLTYLVSQRCSAHAADRERRHGRRRVCRHRRAREHVRALCRDEGGVLCAAIRGRFDDIRSMYVHHPRAASRANADEYSAGTLDAYINKYTSLVPYLSSTASGQPPSDPAPEDQTTKAISLQVCIRGHAVLDTC